MKQVLDYSRSNILILAAFGLVILYLFLRVETLKLSSETKRLEASLTKAENMISGVSEKLIALKSQKSVAETARKFLESGGLSSDTVIKSEEKDKVVIEIELSSITPFLNFISKIENQSLYRISNLKILKHEADNILVNMSVSE